MQLKDIQQKAIDQILAERQKNGPYRSFDDFLARVVIDPTDVKILIKAGVFDEIEPTKTRPELMWRLMFWQNNNLKKQNGMFSLFDEDSGKLPHAENYDFPTQLKHECETLGFLISRHPLALYKERLKTLTYILAKDLPLFVGKHVTTIGWLVTRKITRTKKSELMEFISFEDTSAIYETVFFPKTYHQFCYMLSHSRPYILKGKVDEEFGAVTLNVSEVKFL
jgi:error-prone DNA polymerase